MHTGRTVQQAYVVHSTGPKSYPQVVHKIEGTGANEHIQQANMQDAPFCEPKLQSCRRWMITVAIMRGYPEHVKISDKRAFKSSQLCGLQN